MRRYENTFIAHSEQCERVPALDERYRATIAIGNEQLRRLEDCGRRQSPPTIKEEKHRNVTDGAN